jgi:dTMP kinase
MGINLKFIQYINNYLLRGVNVDFTILNLVNLQNMKKRLTERKNLNRYDKFNSHFYEKVQKGFIKLSKKNPKKYMKIDSNLDIDINEKIIINKIVDLT